MPLVAFWIKTIAEIVNLAVFGRKGAKHREGATYGEGFWAAVFSCGLSGVVAALLLFHYTVQRHETWKDSLRSATLSSLLRPWSSLSDTG